MPVNVILRFEEKIVRAMFLGLENYKLIMANFGNFYLLKTQNSNNFLPVEKMLSLKVIA
jgi:hypothetical protein